MKGIDYYCIKLHARLWHCIIFSLFCCMTASQGDIYIHTHTHEFLFQKYTAGVNKEKEKNKENCSSHHCSKRHSHYFIHCLETTRYSLNGRLCSNLVVLQSYLVLQLWLPILGKGEIKYLIKLFAVFLCVFVLCFLLNKKTWLIHYLKKSNVLEHLEQQ